MDELRKRLANHQVVGLDTALLIYQFENKQPYAKLGTVVFEAIISGEIRGVVSTVSLMEVQVLPKRLGQDDLAIRYDVLLNHFPNLVLSDVTVAVARKASDIRAEFNLKSADSLLIATAIVSGATLWLTNDKHHRRIGELIEVLVLDDFV